MLQKEFVAELGIETNSTEFQSLDHKPILSPGQFRKFHPSHFNISAAASFPKAPSHDKLPLQYAALSWFCASLVLVPLGQELVWTLIQVTSPTVQCVLWSHKNRQKLESSLSLLVSCCLGILNPALGRGRDGLEYLLGFLPALYFYDSIILIYWLIMPTLPWYFTL